jgi:hypothetical protein
MNEIQLTRQFVDPPGKYDILSVCLFRMKKSYKRPLLYTKGLEYTVKNLRTYLPNFYIRIYYDKSVEHEQVIRGLRNNGIVQLVKYHHPWFADADGYHPGTFGTIVRLFPLFNKEGNVNIVLVGDIENNEIMFPFWKTILEFFRGSPSQVHMLERSCSSTAERTKKVFAMHKLPFSPFLNSFWSKISFPPEMLQGFFECIRDSALRLRDPLCADVKLFVHDTDHVKVNKTHTDAGEHAFMYGIDEICLLRMFEYVQSNGMCYSFHTFPDIMLPYKEAYKANLSSIMKDPLHQALAKEFLGKYYDPGVDEYTNFSQLFHLLSDWETFFTNYDNMEKLAYLSVRTKGIYKDMLRKGTYSKYGLHADTLKCVASDDNMYLRLIPERKDTIQKHTLLGLGWLFNKVSLKATPSTQQSPSK